VKVLSFLGTGSYHTVTYVWEGAGESRKVQTHLFPEAVARIFQPDKLLVLVTPEVERHENFPTLCERLGDLAEPVPIPEGKTTEELWGIFDTCASKVSEGDELLLDVTHAFRSLPLIVFTVAAYLRRTKGITIRHIVYGAYEAREPFHNPPEPTDRVPIFDLTLLLDLLDWLSGAEAFLRRSDATLLAERLEQTHRRLWKERQAETLPQRLQTLANKLQRLSQALHLSRPLDVMCYAKDLLPLLGEAASEVERWAKPFAVILQQVRDEVISLVHIKPERLDADHLRKQLALIECYLKKDLTVQVVLLAREWVVSWVTHQRGKGDWLDKNFRENEIEKALNAAAACERGESTQVPEWFEQLPKSHKVAQLWNWLTLLRNDVAHCGMKKDAASGQSIKQRAEELLRRLWSLLNGTPGHAIWSGRVIIDLKELYGEVAKLDELPVYLERAKEQAGEGNEVVLTGQAPIWLYLAVAHALHGRARKLFYESPTTGEVCIFDHSAR
jgi:CRISPR-associated DxTHG motif protein